MLKNLEKTHTDVQREVQNQHRNARDVVIADQGILQDATDEGMHLPVAVVAITRHIDNHQHVVRKVQAVVHNGKFCTSTNMEVCMTMDVSIAGTVVFPTSKPPIRPLVEQCRVRLLP